MPRSLADSATRLPAPVTVERDYSRHPIPGQLLLFSYVGDLPRSHDGRDATAEIPAGQNETDVAWLRRMVNTHGHGGL